MHINKDGLEKLETILKELYRKPFAEPFRQPVDYEYYQLVDYPQIIKKMMDLRTLIYDLDNGKYQTVEQVLDDIQLIWDNCKLYNDKNTRIHKAALKLEKLTEKLVFEQFGEIEYGKNNPSYFALIAKNRQNNHANT